MTALRARRVLVTGASGLLGAWVVEELLGLTASVVGLDRERRAGSRLNEFESKIDFVSGDLEDFDFVLRILNEHEIEFVFHLAAQAIVGTARRNPLSTFRSNVEATWNILEASRLMRAGSKTLKGIIVASSDKAYGDNDKLPYKEDFPMQGRFPYDVSKSCADLIARSYFHTYGLPVCVTRCGNLFGGGDLNWSRIVPGTIRHALEGSRPVVRSDGTPVRDYIYVRDAVFACLKLGEAMLGDDSLYGEAFNISNETPLSVIDMVEKILKLTGQSKLSPVILGTATGEIKDQYLSAEKLRSRVNWKPAFDLDSGLAETIEWYKRYFRQAGSGTPLAAL